MAGHDRRDCELAARASFLAAGGCDVDEAWNVVTELCGFEPHYVRTGLSRSKTDENGEPVPAGRGPGLWDIAFQGTPVSLKAVTDRDLTMQLDLVEALKGKGKAILVFLLRWGSAGGLEMRRLDACRVLREIPENEKIWFVREDRRSYGSDTNRARPSDFTTSANEVATSYEVGPFVKNGRTYAYKCTKTYKRLRIEWGKVPDRFFYDEGWVPFRPELP